MKMLIADGLQIEFIVPPPCPALHAGFFPARTSRTASSLPVSLRGVRRRSNLWF